MRPCIFTQNQINQANIMSKRINELSKEEIAKFYKSNDNVKKNLMYAIREEKTFQALMKDMKKRTQEEVKQVNLPAFINDIVSR